MRKGNSCGTGVTWSGTGDLGLASVAAAFGDGDVSFDSASVFPHPHAAGGVEACFSHRAWKEPWGFRLRCSLYLPFRDNWHREHGGRCHGPFSGWAGGAVLDGGQRLDRAGTEIRGGAAGGGLSQAERQWRLDRGTLCLYRPGPGTEIQAVGRGLFLLWRNGRIMRCGDLCTDWQRDLLLDSPAVGGQRQRAGSSASLGGSGSGGRGCGGTAVGCACPSVSVWGHGAGQPLLCPGRSCHVQCVSGLLPLDFGSQWAAASRCAPCHLCLPVEFGKRRGGGVRFHRCRSQPGRFFQ